MIISALFLPEIVSAAVETASSADSGLQKLLVPPGWGDPTELAKLGRAIRDVPGGAAAGPPDGGPVGPEGALVVLSGFFEEGAPAAFRMTSGRSAVSVRVLAASASASASASDGYGLVIDLGAERAVLTIVGREDLEVVAQDLLTGDGGSGTVMIHAGGDAPFGAEFTDGAHLVSALATRP